MDDGKSDLRSIRRDIRRMRKGSRRRSHAGSDIGAFPVSPTKIVSFLDDVDLLIMVLANVAAVKNVGAECVGVKVEIPTPRIAEANGVKFRPDQVGIDGQAVEVGDADKRIVRRDQIVGADRKGSIAPIGLKISRALVDIDPKDAGKQTVGDNLPPIVSIML